MPRKPVPSAVRRALAVALSALAFLVLILPVDGSLVEDQWTLDAIGVRGLAEKGIDGGGIVVAVLDSGIQKDHPDLAGRFWSNPADPPNGLDDDLNGHVDDVDGWDFCHDQAPRTRPAFYHGTFVAGVLAADGSEDGGVLGVAPGVRLMDVQVFCDNDAYPGVEPILGRDSVRSGLRYAIDHGADVILMSLQLWDDKAPGTIAGLLPYEEEFQAAHDAGIVLVAAAGNLGEEGPSSPGDRQHVITVGATTGCGFRHGFSNWGSGIDLYAPGRALSTLLGGGHEWKAGTSFAAPMVAGTVAMLKQRDPGISPDEVLGILLGSARESEDGPVLDVHEVFGSPRAQGDASLSLPQGSASGRTFIQYEVHGAMPPLLELDVVGQGRFCYDLVQGGALEVFPPIELHARAHGADWTGPWLNTTLEKSIGADRYGDRPLAVAAPVDPGARDAGAVGPLAILVALGLGVLGSRRTR